MNNNEIIYFDQVDHASYSNLKAREIFNVKKF